MSSAKSLETCNLRDCIKVSGSSFRWGSIWDIPLLSWPLLGEILHEVSMKNLSCQLLMCYWTFRPFPEANLQDPLWTDLKAELVHPTLVNLGMWPCDRNEMAQEWREKGALCCPDHQTTCAQIYTDNLNTHRLKMKPVPRPTTPASATTCQFMISRMMSTSSMFRWGCCGVVFHCPLANFQSCQNSFLQFCLGLS